MKLITYALNQSYIMEYNESDDSGDDNSIFDEVEYTESDDEDSLYTQNNKLNQMKQNLKYFKKPNTDDILNQSICSICLDYFDRPDIQNSETNDNANTNTDSDSGLTVNINTNTNANELVNLSCKHIFHADCINNWLCIKKSCPYCKAEAYIYSVHRLCLNLETIKKTIRSKCFDKGYYYSCYIFKTKEIDKSICEQYWNLAIDINFRNIRHAIRTCSSVPYINEFYDIGIKYCDIALNSLPNINNTLSYENYCHIHISYCLFLIKKYQNNYSQEIGDKIYYHFDQTFKPEFLIISLLNYYKKRDTNKFKTVLLAGINESNNNLCLHNYGMIMMEEKNYTEGIKYLTQALDNNYWSSGFNLARYYRHVEKNFEKSGELFNKIILNTDGYIKKVAQVRYINMLHDIEDLVKANEICQQFDISEEPEFSVLGVLIEHNIRVKNVDLVDKYYKIGCEMFEKKYSNFKESELNINSLVKRISRDLQLYISTMSAPSVILEKNNQFFKKPNPNEFPIGFYLYMKIRNKQPFLQNNFLNPIPSNVMKYLEKFYKKCTSLSNEIVSNIPVSKLKRKNKKNKKQLITITNTEIINV